MTFSRSYVLQRHLHFNISPLTDLSSCCVLILGITWGLENIQCQVTIVLYSADHPSHMGVLIPGPIPGVLSQDILSGSGAGSTSLKSFTNAAEEQLMWEPLG